MAVGTVGRFGVEGPLTSTPPLEKRHLGTMVVGTGLDLIRSNSTAQMCLAAPGYLLWKSATSSGACKLSQGSQVLCSAPKSFHFIKYCSFQFIILLSRTSSTTHSSSPSTISGRGGRGGCRPTMGSGGAVMSLTTLKTGWFHGLGEVETIGIVPNLPFDGKGAEMPMRELLRRPGGLNVAGVER